MATFGFFDQLKRWSLTGNSQLHVLLENIPFEIAVYDTNGYYEFINDNYFTAGIAKDTLLGKDDLYLFKTAGLDLSTVESRLKFLRQALESRQTVRFTESIQVSESGKTYYFKRTFHPIVNPRNNKVVRIASYGSNLTAVILSQKELKYLAFHDKLTGLGNRDAFTMQAEQFITEASRQQTPALAAILFCDLDNFKLVNDSLGHDIGDLVLIEAANRMKNVLRKSDYIFRLGGDEFTIILKNLAHEYDAAHVAEKIITALSTPYEIEDHYINYISASLGIALFPKDGKDREALLANADAAMYAAKKKTKNSFQYFSKTMTDSSKERLSIVKNLKEMIQKQAFDDQFKLVYQPIVEQFDNGEFFMVGCEALLRWTSPQLGNISPGLFIPIAEETNLIHSFGSWILQKSIQDLTYLKNKHPDNHFYFSVNFSAKQLKSPELVHYLKRLVDSSGINPAHFQIEITETSVLEGETIAFKNLDTLKKMGFRLAIDDFGTGFSSLIYLQKIPAHTIKVDRSFISRLSNGNNRALLKSILTLGKDLGKEVVAEGVEELSDLEFLLANECFHYQGYLFSRPLPFDEFDKLLDNQVPLHSPKKQ